MAQFYSPKRRVTTRQSSQIFTVTVSDLDPFGRRGAPRRQSGVRAGRIAGRAGGNPADRRQAPLRQRQAQTPAEPQPAAGGAALPAFRRRGGCQQQHADEALQQQSKAAALVRMIARETGVTPQQEPVIAGPEYGYRRRARLSLAWQPKPQRLMMGFDRRPPASWWRWSTARCCGRSWNSCWRRCAPA